MRSCTVILVVVGLALAGCGRGLSDSGVSYSAGVIASLSANANLSSAQSSTFKADVRSRWAAAYDPAVPPGCSPGGLGTGAGAPPLGERPCKVYVLERMKTTWFLRAVGFPGQVAVPEGTPSDLGHPDRLAYLGS